MVSTTKKLGPAGRFGARYGSLARKQVATVERVQRRKHACTRCGAHAVVRLHTSIWACRKCDHQFAGGAYVPQTGAGRGARKALRGISDRLLRGEAMEEETSFHALVAEEEADELAEYESYEEELAALEHRGAAEGAEAPDVDDTAEPGEGPETAEESETTEGPEASEESTEGPEATDGEPGTEADDSEDES